MSVVPIFSSNSRSESKYVYLPKCQTIGLNDLDLSYLICSVNCSIIICWIHCPKRSKKSLGSAYKVATMYTVNSHQARNFFLWTVPGMPLELLKLENKSGKNGNVVIWCTFKGPENYFLNQLLTVCDGRPTQTHYFLPQLEQHWFCVFLCFSMRFSLFNVGKTQLGQDDVMYFSALINIWIRTRWLVDCLITVDQIWLNHTKSWRRISWVSEY